MTKTFETFYSGSLVDIQNALKDDPQQQQGEFVILLQGAAKTIESDQSSINSREVLNILLNELSLKQAVSLATKITGEHKNRLYQWALEVKK